MSQPLVIAYHLIWTVYGHWLPNDPRGSGSRIVRSTLLAELGKPHYGRKQTQPRSSEINQFYTKAENLLSHKLLPLSETDRTTAARGLATALTHHRYTCYACAIMPDHVHFVIRKHRHSAEEMIENLQGLSRERLVADGNRAHNHPVWTAGGWRVFLDRPSAIRRTIRYIECNPQQQGLSSQSWPFVTAYNNWPLHPGHSPDSPYAKRLGKILQQE